MEHELWILWVDLNLGCTFSLYMSIILFFIIIKKEKQELQEM